MNLDWILSPLTIYATIAAGWIAVLSLAVAWRIELARETARSADTNEALTDTIAQLSARLDELATDTLERATPHATEPVPSAINMNKRWEVLRMFRNGADVHTISGALRVPLAEVSLLRTVQGIVAENIGKVPDSRLAQRQ